MAEESFEFPKDFVWGSATASYQIEGAWDEDGRKPSIWDTFCDTPGKVEGGVSGRVACDHYHRWQEDLELIKRLGLDSYRLSLAWPRIIPEGRGAVNAKGFDFYNRLIDALLEAGIRPNVTLYHWDLPQPLEDKGGWTNRDTALAYGDYAVEVVKMLGDRVDLWATLNEPQVFVHHGYEHGVHAPGRRENRATVLQCIHNVLLAHGLGMKAIRDHGKPGTEAGIVWAPNPIWPASEKAEDVEAAKRHWRMSNDWWIDPVVRGEYPSDVKALLGADAPKVEDGDMALISAPIDYMGLNYYSPARTAADPGSESGFKVLPPAPDAPRPSMPEWEIFAPGLQNLLVQFKRHYGDIPLYISENGMSIAEDSVGPDGKVHDPRRIDFLRDHLVSVHRALQAGVKVKGYYVWSLLDNFEWGYGYNQRFGITHVDYQTLVRTPKDSFDWYASVVKANGLRCEPPPVALSGFDQAPLPETNRNVFG